MKDLSKGITYALITTFLWGLLPIALKATLKAVPSFTIVWVRFSFAFIALLIYFLITDRKQLKILIKPPLKLIIAAIGLMANYIGFMLGVKYTTPSNAQVFIQIGQILLAIAGIFLFKEKVRKQQLLGFVIVIIGFILFYSQQLKSILINIDDFNKGVIITIIGAFAWATYAIMQKFLVKDYPTQTLNLFLFGLPSLLLIPTVNFDVLGNISWQWWILLIFLGANTLVAYGCMAGALKYLEANKVSTIVINNPIITFITMAALSYFQISWIIPEHFSFLVWAGAALFLLGAFIVIRSGKK